MALDRQSGVRWRVPFFAALPHELDCIEPTKADLPLYVKRVDDLMHHARLAADEISRLREAGDALAAAVQERWSGPGGCSCRCCSAADAWRRIRERTA